MVSKTILLGPGAIVLYNRVGQNWNWNKSQAGKSNAVQDKLTFLQFKQIFLLRIFMSVKLFVW
jgi:hypothetical protein